MDALREAVVNAIVHRNYAIKGTSIYVRIYDDRVEIENPGGLPDGITKRDFAKSSVRRNPIIADLFHRVGKVERMGSGIERMRELMRNAGLKEPMFEMADFFRVTFYRNPRYSLKANRLGEKGAEKEDTTQKDTQKDTQKIPRKYPEELSGNQLNLLALLEKDGSLKREQLAEKLNISPETVKKNLAKLKHKKLIKRIGPDKGGHWEIVKAKT